MDVKMIVTDLDGTLLREDKTISGLTLSALKQCREKGMKIVYATGRGESSKILAPSEFFDGFVRMNGATAYLGDTLVYSRLIPIENIRDLLIAVNNEGFKIAIEYNGNHYANFDVTEKWAWLPHYEVADFSVLDVEVEKFFAVVETPEVPEFISKHLPDGLYMYVSRDGLAMVMHEEAIKSNALIALADHWGIKPAEIVAFGDDTNDIDLLERCGIGVAMGNALDEAKCAADYICDTNDDDGIAKWLEENVLSEQQLCRKSNRFSD